MPVCDIIYKDMDVRIHTEPDECLHGVAEAVADINGEIRDLTAAMLEAMYQARGIGLAGPQVGRALRVFVMQAPEDVARVIINPTVEWVSNNSIVAEEGCLSLPGAFGDIKRPESLRVSAYDQHGAHITLEAAGMQARVILHEIDHLDGILFWDRMARHSRRRLQRRYHEQQGTPAPSARPRSPRDR